MRNQKFLTSCIVTSPVFIMFTLASRNVKFIDNIGVTCRALKSACTQSVQNKSTDQREIGHCLYKQVEKPVTAV